MFRFVWFAANIQNAFGMLQLKNPFNQCMNGEFLFFFSPNIEKEK